MIYQRFVLTLILNSKVWRSWRKRFTLEVVSSNEENTQPRKERKMAANTITYVWFWLSCFQNGRDSYFRIQVPAANVCAPGHISTFESGFFGMFAIRTICLLKKVELNTFALCSAILNKRSLILTTSKISRHSLRSRRLKVRLSMSYNFLLNSHFTYRKIITQAYVKLNLNLPFQLHQSEITLTKKFCSARYFLCRVTLACHSRLSPKKKIDFFLWRGACDRLLVTSVC